MWYCMHVVHVVLCTCGPMYVHCVCGIVTCVFVVLHSMYLYVLCCTLDVGVFFMLYIRCRCMHCVVHHM